MNAIKRNALGKGLSALLEDRDVVESHANAEHRITNTASPFSNIKVEQIVANPYQPRTAFDEIALGELADSIKIHGIIQPITVRKISESSYQLISGERRFRASKIAGLEEIPAYIRTANDQQMLEMALIENIQRENLNAIEIAITYQQMMEECNLRQEELGERVGKNRATITNYLRLLKLPPVIQAAIRDNKLSMGHARALINVDAVEKQLWIFNETMNKDLSVRKVEELVRSMGKERKEPSSIFDLPNGVFYKKIQDDLSSKFGTKIALKMDDNGKGKIEIPVLSTDDLNRILEIFR